MDLSASQGPACAFYSLEIMITSNQAPGIAKIKGSVDTEMGHEGPGSPHLPGVGTHPRDAPTPYPPTSLPDSPSLWPSTSSWIYISSPGS